MQFYMAIDPDSAFGLSQAIQLQLPALLGGHVDLLFSAYPSLSGAIESKKVTLLANKGPGRSAQAPDAPPVADTIPGFDFAPVIGLFARAGTPDAIIQKIASEVAVIVKQPDVIKQFATAGIEPLGLGPADYAKAMAGEIQRVNDVVKVAGICLARRSVIAGAAPL